MPLDEGAEVLDGQGERLVDENGEASFDERLRASDVVEAIIGRDQHGVDVANDVGGIFDDVRNEPGSGDGVRYGGVVSPDVGHLSSGNAERFAGLGGAEVLRDDGKRAA